MLCDQLGWNMFEIKVEITWRMLQIEISQSRDVGVPICSDEIVNLIFRFTRINGINMQELHLNNKPRRENSSNMELTQVQSNS
jgi:hypothetical protein